MHHKPVLEGIPSAPGIGIPALPCPLDRSWNGLGPLLLGFRSRRRQQFPKLHSAGRWYMHTSVVLCARVLKRTGGRLWVKPHLSPYPSENSKSAAYNQRVRADKAQAVTETLKRAEALESIQAHLPAPTIKPNGRQWAWKVLVRKLDKEKKLQKKHAPSGSFAASAVSKN